MKKLNKSNDFIYGPKERNYLNASPQTILSCSLNDCIILPDPFTDPIVTNDISTSEFDYTFNGGDLVEDKVF
ncbi:hypothetical protein [Clostridium grantii]|uniref:Uncharacterized protein n=1 Tax=Clostridium grantii DSM 8605 TaxID=1121316 RepID=A0A1M5QJV8_9CLOT|nr:hypothetical protein [Clostridium grantii]SHH14141.1 hypothetical protein SAMN02745207_00133 [Clostridium grantii DSM 8605]